MRFVGPADLLRRFGWFMSAERISWFVLFPLEVYFFLRDRWIAFGVCLVFNAGILILRETHGNFRISWRARAQAHVHGALDREAEQCLATLRASRPWKRRPIILFLRPFSADMTLRLRDPGLPDGYDAMPSESRLMGGFNSWCTTVALRGGPLPEPWSDAFVGLPYNMTVYHPDFYKHEGRLFYERAGEVKVSNETWFETFRLLAANAALIVSIPIDASPDPEPSAAVLELFDLHERSLLERCLFVMPPEQRLWWGLTSRQEVALSSSWEATRAKLAARGLELPEFQDNEGAGVTMFTLTGGRMRLTDVPRAWLSRPKRYLGTLGLTL